MLAALIITAGAMAAPAPPVMSGRVIQAVPSIGATPPCRATGPTVAVQRSGVDARKLGELPPPVGIKLVSKTVDGCAVSVLMQRGPDGKYLERPLADPVRGMRARSTQQRGSERQR
jgi:hypothetical protein